MSIVVTADIVGSRLLADRATAQHVLDDAIARVARDLPVADRVLAPTVGDEQQGVFPALDAALAWLLLLQLALPDGVQCRFGVGIGTVADVPSVRGAIPEGPAWWAAREAIDAVHALESRAVPASRTRVGVAEGEPAAEQNRARIANAYLLSRDQLVAGMTERARRLTYGRCLGRTQAELAAQEGITQSAVSQALSAAGSAAVVEGFRLLRAEA